MDSIVDKTCYSCGEPGHMSRDCPSGRSSFGGGRSFGSTQKCYKSAFFLCLALYHALQSRSFVLFGCTTSGDPFLTFHPCTSLGGEGGLRCFASLAGFFERRTLWADGDCFFFFLPQLQSTRSRTFSRLHAPVLKPMILPSRPPPTSRHLVFPLFASVLGDLM